MKSWPFLAGAAAGALVLVAALYLMNSSEHAHAGGARTDPIPSTEHPVLPAPPRHPARAVEGSAAAPRADDDRNQPIPGTERWHYEEYLRLADADPGGFDRLVDARNRPGAPLQDRVALLRAAWKIRGKDALRWYADAFVQSMGLTDTASEALRGFVVRHLAAQARAVPEAREFLRDRVFLNASAGAADRSASGRAVLETADPTQISSLLAAIRGLSDSTAEGAVVGLGLNEHAEALSALDLLSANHPNEIVRERATEIARQRRAGQVGVGDDE